MSLHGKKIRILVAKGKKEKGQGRDWLGKDMRKLLERNVLFSTLMEVCIIGYVNVRTHWTVFH